MAYDSQINIKPAYLWNLAGKYYGFLSLHDTITIIKAKSYLRTNLPKSLKILKLAILKPTVHPIFLYLISKYKLQLLYLTRNKSVESFEKV